MALPRTASRAARIGLALIAGSTIVFGSVATGAASGQSASGLDEDVLIEVFLDDRAELDRLVGLGVDLNHTIEPTDDGGMVAQAIVSQDGAAALRALGFETGNVLWTASQGAKNLKESRDSAAAARAEAAAAVADLEAAAEPLDTDMVVIMRADWYTNGATNKTLYVEARSSAGTTSSTILTLCWDAGPGTAIGDGGCDPMSRFTDAGQYMYHLETRNVTALEVMPTMVSVTSSEGGSATAAVTEWAVTDVSPRNDPYHTDFITGYMDPTELYAAYDALAAEYPDLVEVIDVPHDTNGYRRKAQANMWGGNPGGSVSGGSSNQNRTVVVESLAWGHEGGNDLSIEFLDPGAASSPLSVSVAGNLISVHLGTDAGSALTSTAADVVAAINGSAASSLIRAYTYRGNSGAGIVQAQAATALSDFLDAPAEISRDPFDVKAYRIGKPSGKEKVGVLAYAQEHAREWVPPLVALETATRLLRNYDSDGTTKQWLNEIDVFFLPSVNPDGGHYSFYDSSGQRKNMTNHCGDSDSDPSRRNSWGVDNNRNHSVGSLFDGYDGASTNCLSSTFSGPAEHSEPESKNIVYLADTYPNIKFAMNLHSSGNYFMWPPGAYSLPGRITLPRPTVGEEAYFWASAGRIISEIKEYRNLALSPQRTGPVCDVLYSAAGNSADETWYNYGIYGWDFEVGTSFQPNWTEAHAETMEFANGLVELVHVAYDYGKDHSRPKTTLEIVDSGDGYTEIGFARSEPATIWYTLDGSRPTFGSPMIESAGIRQLDETLTLTESTEVHWFSVDASGNIEGNYNPNGNAENYNKATVNVGS